MVCASCGSRGQYDLHHVYYVWGRNLWDYPDSALEPRCNYLACHPRSAPFISRRLARELERHFRVARDLERYFH